MRQSPKSSIYSTKPNGFAVPISKRDEICAKLNGVSFQFEQLKQDFIKGYNDAVDEWCRENPEYAGAIRAGSLPKETVEARIGFEYQLFMVQPVNEDEGSAKRLNRKIESLGDDLISEVAQEANKFYMERLAGRDQCGITTRQTLRNIRDKVDGLSFLNNAFNPLVKLLDQTLNGYEKHADGRNIVAPFFYQVVAAVLIMSEKERIEQYANGLISVEGMANDIGGSETLTGNPANDTKAEPESVKSSDDTHEDEWKGDDIKQQNNVADVVQSEGNSISNGIDDLSEDIDNFFKNCPELGGSESKDNSNADDTVQADLSEASVATASLDDAKAEPIQNQGDVSDQSLNQEQPEADSSDYFF
ncbi:DUF3150 domain-containing protein (plasmid) [Edwardsiella tarda]|uniref:DUF3150 domain-containing protein n=1 Tax=Edwardsiella tarda TaxID=636 RepID=UPI003F6589AE